jgi:hypothetical protein
LRAANLLDVPLVLVKALLNDSPLACLNDVYRIYLRSAMDLLLWNLLELYFVIGYSYGFIDMTQGPVQLAPTLTQASSRKSSRAIEFEVLNRSALIMRIFLAIQN